MEMQKVADVERFARLLSKPIRKTVMGNEPEFMQKLDEDKYLQLTAKHNYDRDHNHTPTTPRTNESQSPQKNEHVHAKEAGIYHPGDWKYMALGTAAGAGAGALLGAIREKDVARSALVGGAVGGLTGWGAGRLTKVLRNTAQHIRPSDEDLKIFQEQNPGWVSVGDNHPGYFVHQDNLPKWKAMEADPNKGQNHASIPLKYFGYGPVDPKVNAPVAGAVLGGLGGLWLSPQRGSPTLDSLPDHVKHKLGLLDDPNQDKDDFSFLSKTSSMHEDAVRLSFFFKTAASDEEKRARFLAEAKKRGLNPAMMTLDEKKALWTKIQGTSETHEVHGKVTSDATVPTPTGPSQKERLKELHDKWWKIPLFGSGTDLVAQTAGYGASKLLFRDDPMLSQVVLPLAASAVSGIAGSALSRKHMTGKAFGTDAPENMTDSEKAYDRMSQWSEALGSVSQLPLLFGALQGKTWMNNPVMRTGAAFLGRTAGSYLSRPDDPTAPKTNEPAS